MLKSFAKCGLLNHGSPSWSQAWPGENHYQSFEGLPWTLWISLRVQTGTFMIFWLTCKCEKNRPKYIFTQEHPPVIWQVSRRQTAVLDSSLNLSFEPCTGL